MNSPETYCDDKTILIASKTLPECGSRTYFGTGRAAFLFLIAESIQPKRVFLPTLVCWSLVNCMLEKLPHLETRYYLVDEEFRPEYPSSMEADDAVVVIDYFGRQTSVESVPEQATIVEDVSHSFLSEVPRRSQYVFGSLRKLFRVGDGGFAEGFYNPYYEDRRNYATYLRYEATSWSELKEAENSLDRGWGIGDMSSQSLARIFGQDFAAIRAKRRTNDAFLTEHLEGIGRCLIERTEDECPMLHVRAFDDANICREFKEGLKRFKVFPCVHWPMHEALRSASVDITSALWVESHTLDFPVPQWYGEREMEHIVKAAHRVWGST